MKSTVLIGCKLPNGVVLQHPHEPSKKVVLNGINKALIKGANYATTDVDKDFWEAWVSDHIDFAPLRIGAIFMAKDAASANSIAKELDKVKTGFEPMSQKTSKIEKLTAD